MESNNESQANEAAQQTHQTESEENLIVSNFVNFFQPLIQNLDAHVESLRLSQCELTNQIKILLNKISKIYEDEKKKLELDEHTKRLALTKKKLHSIQATIISVQERINKLYVNIQKDSLANQQKILK